MLLLLQTTAQQVANAVPVTDPGIAKWVEGLGDQATLAAGTVWAIQFLKRWPAFKWLNDNTANRTQIVSTIMAIVSGIAVNIHVTGDAAAGWVINVANAHVLWNTVTRVIGQKVGQDWLHNMYDKPIQVVPVTAPVMDEAGKPVAPPQPIVKPQPVGGD